MTDLAAEDRVGAGGRTAAGSSAATAAPEAPDHAAAAPDHAPQRVRDAVVDEAAATAQRAAERAGVQVRILTDLADLTALSQLFHTIWGREQGAPMTPELLRAMSKAGSYVAGAYSDGELIGGAVAFHEEPAVRTLHSHIAGVRPGPWRNVGSALKLHQRAWALERGIDHIVWTFDPLVSRNAYFNIVKLGAMPVEYLPNFYGTMADAINGHDDTDRLVARWPLRDPDVVVACAGHAPHVDELSVRGAGAERAVRLVDGRPEPVATDADIVIVPVPADIAAVRGSDIELARQWRRAVRDVLAPLLAGGGRVIGFDRGGAYLVRRAGAASDPTPLRSES
ncbi:GNAT family N-acetyltransferase [Microbacterium sp. C7(2022)]|uniref:GNAT family N-acetyltransferase n=1 Tax=Microbacterium sp. C7(2022) TaxID=2992759 RepID=UPI00237A69A2|nr:GNAT family N-acetyltransferase [Microbacterium sp. C7(2022)]MDE0545424.1 GNAT family N-acetyltransferase [Microbacterium sp. C7(2022)]